MVSNKRRPRTRTCSPPVPKSNTLSNLHLPNHNTPAASYNSISHSSHQHHLTTHLDIPHYDQTSLSQDNTKSHHTSTSIGIPSYAHTTHAVVIPKPRSSQPYHGTTTPTNHQLPHYTNTTHAHQTITTTTDLTPMQLFEQPSPFPYHQHTTYIPPSASSSSSTSTQRHHPSTSLTSIKAHHHSSSDTYSARPESRPYSSSQAQNYYQGDAAHPASEQEYNVTWEQDNFSGIGYQFQDVDARGNY